MYLNGFRKNKIGDFEKLFCNIYSKLVKLGGFSLRKDEKKLVKNFKSILAEEEFEVMLR